MKMGFWLDSQMNQNVADEVRARLSEYRVDKQCVLLCPYEVDPSNIGFSIFATPSLTMGILQIHDPEVNLYSLSSLLAHSSWTTLAYKVVVTPSPSYQRVFKPKYIKMIEDVGVDLYISESPAAYIRGTTSSGVPYITTDASNTTELSWISSIQCSLLSGKKWVRKTPSFGIFNPREENLEVVMYGLCHKVGVLDGFHIKRKNQNSKG